MVPSDVTVDVWRSTLQKYSSTRVCCGKGVSVGERGGGVVEVVRVTGSCSLGGSGGWDGVSCVGIWMMQRKLMRRIRTTAPTMMASLLDFFNIDIVITFL
jgi:hypothetical protein